MQGVWSNVNISGESAIKLLTLRPELPIYSMVEQTPPPVPDQEVHRTTMSIEADTASPAVTDSLAPATLPTTPCAVVWSLGRPFVLEGALGRARWVGTDEHGRPQVLTEADLRRRGWSHRRN